MESRAALKLKVALDCARLQFPEMEKLKDLAILFGTPFQHTLEISTTAIITSESFVNETDEGDLITVVQHEALHLARNHHERKTFIMQRISAGGLIVTDLFRHKDGFQWGMLSAAWNVAADMEVNSHFNKVLVDRIAGVYPGDDPFKWVLPWTVAEFTFMQITMVNTHADETIRFMRQEGWLK